MVARDCKKVIQHRERLKRLLENPDYYLCEDTASRVVKFIERNIRHYREPHSGKPFHLEEWQKLDIVVPLFAIKRKADNERLFKRAYIQIGRGNGKTALGACIALYEFFTCGGGGEIYSVATTRQQARRVFDDASAFVRSSPALKRRLGGGIERHRLYYPANNSVFMPLSGDYNSLDSLSINLVIVDELHAHKDNKVLGLMETGANKRPSGLVVMITTAGIENTGPAKDQYEYAENVLNGSFEDDRYFAYIAEADKELDWTSDEAIIQANPNLDVSIRMEEIQAYRNQAINSPTIRREYQQKHLNRFVSGGSERWLDVDAWKSCAEDYTEEDMEGLECYGALDLSATQDITAFSLLFPLSGGEIRTLSWYWLPEEGIQEKARKDKVTYDVWHQEGYLNLTTGNCIDYQEITEFILSLRERYNIKQIAYDDWNAIPVYTRLIEEGVDMVKFVQGLHSFHPPSMEFERMILEEKITHNQNPITQWMIGNVKVLRDHSGKIRPIKENKDSSNKIDGVITLIMALSLIIRNKPQDKAKVDYKSIPSDFRRLLGV